MVFFTSKNRVAKLSFIKKLWMTPTAYILKYLAGGVLFLADRFDEKVTFEILTKTSYEGR